MRVIARFVAGVALVLVPGVPALALTALVRRGVDATAPRVVVSSDPVSECGPAPTQGASRDASGARRVSPTSASSPVQLARVEVPASAPAPARAPLPCALPTEPGPCAVRLVLQDADTGAALAADVRLWRLGLPADDEWTAGDALLCVERVPAAGLDITGLHPGRYRAECPDQRGSADDPPEFEVTAERGDVVLGLRMPRSFRVHLVVVDETGARVSRGRGRSGLGCSRVGGARRPPWARPRRRKSAGDDDDTGFGGGRACRSVGALGDWAVDGQERFDLGIHEEGTRFRQSNADLGVEPEGRATVWVNIRGDTGEDRTFLGVAPSLETLFRGVRAPDGVPLRFDPAWVEAYGNAERVEELGEEGWRALSVVVVVRVPEYEACSFVWTVATASSVRTLVPVRPR